MTTPPLHDLAVLYGTDKAEHGYGPAYEEHFARGRESVARVLEIGVLDGASLFMWRDYFPHADILGLDIVAKPHVFGPRIETMRGSQADAEFLTRVGKGRGKFDVIIDDGSHVPSHVITSLETLFPYVRPGGTYVIEDLQTSYWPDWQQGSPQTSMDYLKDLCDGLNHVEYQRNPSYLDTHIEAMEFRHNLCFLRKML